MTVGDFVSITATPYAFGVLVERWAGNQDWWVILTIEGNEIIWPESQLNLAG